MLILDVCDGKVMAWSPSSDQNPAGTFEPTVEGRSALATFLRDRGVTQDVMCSSSVDFPGEYGLPGFDARTFISEALSEAAATALRS